MFQVKWIQFFLLSLLITLSLEEIANAGRNYKKGHRRPPPLELPTQGSSVKTEEKALADTYLDLLTNDGSKSQNDSRVYQFLDIAQFEKNPAEDAAYEQRLCDRLDHFVSTVVQNPRVVSGVILKQDVLARIFIDLLSDPRFFSEPFLDVLLRHKLDIFREIQKNNRTNIYANPPKSLINYAFHKIEMMREVFLQMVSISWVQYRGHYSDHLRTALSRLEERAKTKEAYLQLGIDREVLKAISDLDKGLSPVIGFVESYLKFKNITFGILKNLALSQDATKKDKVKEYAVWAGGVASQIDWYDLFDSLYVMSHSENNATINRYALFFQSMLSRSDDYIRGWVQVYEDHISKSTPTFRRLSTPLPNPP